MSERARRKKNYDTVSVSRDVLCHAGGQGKEGGGSGGAEQAAGDRPWFFVYGFQEDQNATATRCFRQTCNPVLINS